LVFLVAAALLRREFGGLREDKEGEFGRKCITIRTGTTKCLWTSPCHHHMDTNSEYSSSSPEESDTEELQMNPIQGAGQESQNGGDQDGDSKQSTILNNGLHLDEELGGLVSKYAKVNQPVPFSTEPPRLRLNLAWKDLNYKVVIPLPPQNFFVRMLLKLPIPNTVANFFKKKKEIPILNHLSGSVRAGEVVAIMGPTGSGKVPLFLLLPSGGAGGKPPNSAH